MENWIISDEGSNSFTINGSLIVSAQSYLVLGEETDTSINGGAPVDYAWGTDTNFTLGNGDDEVIISCGGNIIDMVAYDNGDTFPDESGYSMQSHLGPRVALLRPKGRLEEPPQQATLAVFGRVFMVVRD